jgi:protocatechuate 3,4-dioxygenase beta subunit
MNDRSNSPALVPDPTTPGALGTSTRRTFVGAVGAVLWGCGSSESDPSAPQQTAAADEGGGVPSPAPADLPEESSGQQPMGTAAESGDEAPQATALQNEGTPTGSQATPTTTSTPGSCTLYPEQTEGPYYVAGDLLRADLREGKPGAPLTLDLLVLSAGGCTPIANAAVDIWHCDAAGVYSGYQGQLGGLDTRGAVFLRGTQLTGADGRVQFQTIYPGWYPGRTTHIHFKVHLTGNREATSQLYFAEELNREVYASAPYASHGQKDTANTADMFERDAPLLAVTRTGQGYAASMTITVAG